MKRINIIKDIFKKGNKVMKKKELLKLIKEGIEVNKNTFEIMEENFEVLESYTIKDLEKINKLLFKCSIEFSLPLTICNEKILSRKENDIIADIIKENLPKDIAEDILKCL